MGSYHSTRTRVVPVFDALRARDTTGQSWLPALLTLPVLNGHAASPASSGAPLAAWGWGDHERRLAPPRSLLRWLVQHLTITQGGMIRGTLGETWARRQALLNRDPAMIAEALTLLDQPTLPDRAWYILEGPSRPDVYLETPDLLVVIEGKRTEPGLTTDTIWMAGRHQMLRHLDTAWEVRAGREIAGFFIFEGPGGADATAVPAHWETAAQETISPSTITASLPHRTPEERTAIASSFLGVTTWQRICQALSLDWSALPNTTMPPTRTA